MICSAASAVAMGLRIAARAIDLTLLSATTFLLLTLLNGNPMWVAKEQIAAVSSPTQISACAAVAKALVILKTGTQICVRETPQQVLEKLNHEGDV